MSYILSHYSKIPEHNIFTDYFFQILMITTLWHVLLFNFIKYVNAMCFSILYLLFTLYSNHSPIPHFCQSHTSKFIPLIYSPPPIREWQHLLGYFSTLVHLFPSGLALSPNESAKVGGKYPVEGYIIGDWSHSNCERTYMNTKVYIFYICVESIIPSSACSQFGGLVFMSP